MDEVTPELTQLQKSSTRRFISVQFVAGLLIGAFVAGGAVFLWQQRTWQPVVEGLKKEYAQLNDDYLSYQPPTRPTPATDSATPDYGNGKQISTGAEEFSAVSVGFFMPGLTGKQFATTVYAYKDKKITELRLDTVDSDGRIGLDVWRYESSAGNKDIPEDFVTFYGYENYSLYASPVAVTMADPTDTYTASDGTVWKYQYEYAPRSIGVVSLTAFIQPQKNKTGKPLFVRLWRPLDLGHQKTDPEVSATKIEIAKTVDSIVF